MMQVTNLVWFPPLPLIAINEVQITEKQTFINRSILPVVYITILKGKKKLQ